MKKLTQYWIINFNNQITWFAVYDSYEEPVWEKNCKPLYSFKIK